MLPTLAGRHSSAQAAPVLSGSQFVLGGLHCLSRRNRIFAQASLGLRASSNSWIVPQKVIKPQLDTKEELDSAHGTVYTIRLTTSYDRGSALSEPNTAVNVCLISKDGVSLIHRVAAVNDPDQSRNELEDICNLVDDSVGANCQLATTTDTPWRPAAASPKHRFQEGSVDEVSFLAPDLGPLAALMVAPESGCWALDEVHVSSSRTNHMDRFVCRRKIGVKAEMAAYLSPIPAGAVVYGTGDTALVLSQEQAAAFRASGMSQYGELKQRLMTTTALLTLGGTGVAGLVGGIDAAIPFALGGLAGVMYQYLLQVGVDSIAANVNAAKTGQQQEFLSWDRYQQQAIQLLGSPAFRMVAVVLALLVAAWAMSTEPASSPVEAPRAMQALQQAGSVAGAGAREGLQLPVSEAWQLAVGLMGFLMYKVSVVSVAMSPAEAPALIKQYEKNT